MARIYYVVLGVEDLGRRGMEVIRQVRELSAAPANTPLHR